MRTVFLRRLRHETHIGHAAHGLRIKGAVLLTELDDFVIDRGVAGVGDDALVSCRLAVRPPHLAASRE